MSKESYLLNQRANQTIETKCPRCRRETNHSILANYTYKMDDPRCYYWVYTDYEIVKCNGCNFISFREVYADSECIDYNENGELVHGDIEKRYPSIIVSSRIKDYNINYIPYTCRSIYEETEFSLANNQVLLSAMGLRALIESICNSQEQFGNIKFKSDNLYEKINELVNKKKLTEESGEILHKIRGIGNESTHELKPTNISHLKIAFDIIENLLVMLYVFPKEFSKE